METKKIKGADLEQGDIPLSFGETKRVSPLFQGERGITLVALIITVIILVILAAVSIAAVYNSKIVNYAINGTQDYATQAIKENKVLDETTKLIDSAVENLSNMLGGNKPGESKPVESKPPEVVGKTKEELAATDMIGKYVDYKPQGTDYTVDKTYSGTDADQTFAANNDMKWRIWGVEGNKLLLISETLAGNIKLSGANGYNNAVKLLNDACSTAFGNSSYGSAITVRSINQDDIDKVTNMTEESQRKEVSLSYGSSYTLNNIECPSIYGQEPTLNRSTQSSWVTGTSPFSSVTYTYYCYSISIYATNTMYYALLTNMSPGSTTGTTDHNPYWVASRYSDLFNLEPDFLVGVVFEGRSDAAYLHSEGFLSRERDFQVRPLVELCLDYFSIGAMGSGTMSSPYAIVKR